MGNKGSGDEAAMLMRTLGSEDNKTGQPERSSTNKQLLQMLSYGFLDFTLRLNLNNSFRMSKFELLWNIKIR